MGGAATVYHHYRRPVEQLYDERLKGYCGEGLHICFLLHTSASLLLAVIFYIENRLLLHTSASLLLAVIFYIEKRLLLHTSASLLLALIFYIENVLLAVIVCIENDL
ncbi:hypothetical protein L2E82_50114 [Cichorium intybus]|nr:hypothetical protein L2E82_50114 [Cichorium intybus]